MCALVIFVACHLFEEYWTTSEELNPVWSFWKYVCSVCALAWSFRLNWNPLNWISYALHIMVLFIMSHKHINNTIHVHRIHRTFVMRFCTFYKYSSPFVMSHIHFIIYTLLGVLCHAGPLPFTVPYETHRPHGIHAIRRHNINKRSFRCLFWKRARI